MCVCVVHNNINASEVRKYLPSNVMRVHAARWCIQSLTPLVLCSESVAGTDISSQTRGNGRTKTGRNRFERPQTNGWKKTSRRRKLLQIIRIFFLSEWDKIKVHLCSVPHDRDWAGYSVNPWRKYITEKQDLMTTKRCELVYIIVILFSVCCTVCFIYLFWYF